MHTHTHTDTGFMDTATLDTYANALDGRDEVLGSDQQKQVSHCFLGLSFMAFNLALGYSQTLIWLPFIVDQRKDS